MKKTTLVLPFSEACERNKDVILDKISPVLESLKCVLEIGSGTAQHAVHFARNCPSITWQTSDQEMYIEGIKAQLSLEALENVLPPVVLNVNQTPWLESGETFDAVFTANTFHIMNKYDVQRFFLGLAAVMRPKFKLIVYGPFKYAGKFTSQSNASFDQTLRSREGGSAIRDFEWINYLAEEAGLSLLSDFKMPANNQLLIWQTPV